MMATLVHDHIAVAPPPGVPVWDVDPYDREILTNPEPFYEELRQRGPFVYLLKYAVLACGRYAETKEVFSDWERFVSSRGVGLSDFHHADNWRQPSIVLEVDPPQHTRARAVIARALSRPAVAALNAAFYAEATEFVDRLLERGTFDAVEDLAEAFSLAVFPKAAGLREINRRVLLDYGAMGFNLLGPDNELRRISASKAPEVVPWLTEQCSRDQLLPDGFGATIFEAADSGEITLEEAGLLIRSMLGAGIDTTVTGIGNTLLCLAENPSEFSRLKADSKLARSAFDEALRLTSPVHSFFRTANVDTEVGGVPIQRDSKILCVLGAANLDPLQWPDPTRYDVTRKTVGHLAFGTGVHGCVGQNVARAEAEAILIALAERVGGIELAGEPVWRPNHGLHALERLPLRFTRP